MPRGSNYNLPLYQMSLAAHQMASPPWWGVNALGDFSNQNLESGQQFVQDASKMGFGMLGPGDMQAADQLAKSQYAGMDPSRVLAGAAAQAGGVANLGRGAGGAISGVRSQMAQARKEQAQSAKEAQAQQKEDTIRQNRIKALESSRRLGLIDDATYAQSMIKIGEPIPEGFTPNTISPIEEYDPKKMRVRMNPETGQYEQVPVVGPDGKPLANENTALSKGAEARDKDFAKEYNEWTSGGGLANSAKQIDALDDAVGRLESGEDLTGGVQAWLPEGARNALYPNSVDVQEIVEGEIQSSLKKILGAQFTEKEGERLLRRTYNKYLDEKTNAARVKRVLNQLRLAAQSKEDAARHFEQHGTLQGWSGQIPTVDTIIAGAGLNDATEDVPKGVTDSDAPWTAFPAGDPRSDPNNWKQQ
ncbi:MAG TPA: hypothetical protein VNA25_05310 [Phycisphaerae bacterium]|nr:hypothetical protein [Phycisphaerae bacterium]